MVMLWCVKVSERFTAAAEKPVCLLCVCNRSQMGPSWQWNRICLSVEQVRRKKYTTQGWEQTAEWKEWGERRGEKREWERDRHKHTREKKESTLGRKSGGWGIEKWFPPALQVGDTEYRAGEEIPFSTLLRSIPPSSLLSSLQFVTSLKVTHRQYNTWCMLHSTRPT